MVGAEVSGHVAADNRGDAEAMDRFGIQDTSAKGLMVLDFFKLL